MTALTESLFKLAGSRIWPHAVTWARKTVLTFLDNIQVGSLTIIDTDGRSIVCGDARATEGDGAKADLVSHNAHHAQVRVHDDRFWARIALFSDTGFAESFMLGEIQCRDLTSFFKIFIANRKHLPDEPTWAASARARLAALMRNTNDLANARLNTAAHYDISNDMFQAFLSSDMTYSCPVWPPGTDHTMQTLQQAQYRKLDLIINRARIQSEDHVLEIGTGWGSFAIRAVQKTGCRVTSITISEEQKKLAEKRIIAAGLGDKVKVVLSDYRSLHAPKCEGEKYDKIVSIEMLEAVGAEYLSTYFRCIDNLLKIEGGIAVFQCITIPESRYEAYRKTDDFIRHYIFPGGHLPTKTQLMESIRSGSSCSHPPRLIPGTMDDIGSHYAPTLRLWKQAFTESFDTRIRPALRKKCGMDEEDEDVFRRKWEYYFSYCETGFATNTLGDAIITVGREGAMHMEEDVLC